MQIQVSDASFAADVLQAEKPVLVDLWAEWCAPCRAVAPVLDALDDELGDQLTIAKINVDDNPQTAAQLDVRSIPTLLLFKDGEIVESTVGAQPIAALENMVRPHLNGAS